MLEPETQNYYYLQTYHLQINLYEVRPDFFNELKYFIKIGPPAILVGIMNKFHLYSYLHSALVLHLMCFYFECEVETSNKLFQIKRKTDSR